LVVTALLLLVQGVTPALRAGVDPPAQRSVDSTDFDQAVLGGIRQGVFPGAALVVGRHDKILFAKGYGHLTWSSSSPGVSVDSTIWDLASLTKVVATTPALMLLVERGKVVLDTRWFATSPHSTVPGRAASRSAIF